VKRIAALLLCLLMVVMLGLTASAKNGAPSGAHFNLNLISVQHPKDMTDTEGGRVIFVLEGKETIITMKKINQFNFMVTDKDATVDGEAEFQIPNPGTEVQDEVYNPETGLNEIIDTGYKIDEYYLYARPLGKPSENVDEVNSSLNLVGGDLNTEVLEGLIEERLIPLYPVGYTFEIEVSDIFFNIIDPLEFTRRKGQSKFQDITSQMMNITVNVKANILVYNELGLLVETLTNEIFTFENVNVFDELFANVFWTYKSNDVKLLQLRFYYTTIPMKGNSGKKK